jgi:hypothetical protein
MEIDLAMTSAGNSSNGLIVTGTSNVASPTAVGIRVQHGIGAQPIWLDDISCDNNSSTFGTCLLVGMRGTGNNNPSLSIQFNGIDSGGNPHSSFIEGDPLGDFEIQPGAGNSYFALTNGGGLEIPGSSSGASTVAAPATGGGTATLPAGSGKLTYILSATSSAFATATTAGTCVQNTTAVTGATTSMAVDVSPVSTPGVGAVWSAYVSSAGNVTINECAIATSAGGTIAFNIRVIPWRYVFATK